jgi:hypothetical protein
MDEGTQDREAKDSPAAGGFCSWHQRFEGEVHRIRLNERTSQDTVHYACIHCIRIYSLTRYEDQ